MTPHHSTALRHCVLITASRYSLQQPIGLASASINTTFLAQHNPLLHNYRQYISITQLLRPHTAYRNKHSPSPPLEPPPSASSPSTQPHHSLHLSKTGPSQLTQPHNPENTFIPGNAAPSPPKRAPSQVTTPLHWKQLHTSQVRQLYHNKATPSPLTQHHYPQNSPFTLTQLRHHTNSLTTTNTALSPPPKSIIPSKNLSPLKFRHNVAYILSIFSC